VISAKAQDFYFILDYRCSHLNGMAVLNACQQVNGRLQPYREKYPDLDFKEVFRKG
jgi:hypothetical protein